MRVYAKDSLTGGTYLRRPRKRDRRRRSPLGAVVRGAAFVAAAWIVLTLGAVAALRFVAPPTSMVMWLEPGPLAAIDYGWIDRSRIAVTAAQAVIAAEDQKFLAHRGFDLEQIDQALAEYREGERLRGASTITQQVAKNLFLWNGRSFVRKGLEAWFALLLELIWSKERILEVYLNIAEFGPGVFGVEAAAGLVGAQPGEMSSRQAATLAAVLPNPKRLRADAPSDYVRMRRDEIERQMRLLEERGHYAGLDW